jgi:KTSC domain
LAVSLTRRHGYFILPNKKATMRTTDPLSSSAIAAVEWDPDEQGPQSITVTFTNGRSYSHANVPLTVVQGLVNAGSAGQYYNRQIKGKYDV